ncbi:MAG: acylphosphatase [Desulfomonilaceae bacterium]
MSTLIRRRVIISGRVQGVCFRAYARDEARRLGIKGWVRNLPDGNVESVIEGEQGAVQAMIQWFHQGPPYGSVSKVTVWDEPMEERFTDFEIRYSFGRM